MSVERVRGEGYDPFEGKSPHPKAVRRDVEVWLQSVAGSLGLCSWSITVSGGVPKGDDSIAETFLRNSGEEAIVALSPRFFEWPESRRRKTLIHELLHATIRGLSVAAWDPIEPLLSRDARDVYRTVFDEAEEQTVDRLAAGLVGLFPESPKGT